MQRQAVREEEPITQETASQKETPAQSAVSWLAGVAAGTVGAAAMTTLARIQNPEMRIGQENAWLLYALLGAITGFCAAGGRPKAARVALGMSLAVFLSPWLLELMCTLLRINIPPAAQSALVINACLPVGAFVFLRKWSPRLAAIYSGIAFFVIDLLYNLIAVGPGSNLMFVAIVSALHGALLGGLLAFLRECFAALQPRKKAP
jgi:membrane-associated HD superfamily phosphohydrolase